jgi:hypothetical protein
MSSHLGLKIEKIKKNCETENKRVLHILLKIFTYRLRQSADRVHHLLFTLTFVDILVADLDEMSISLFNE